MILNPNNISYDQMDGLTMFFPDSVEKKNRNKIKNKIKNNIKNKSKNESKNESKNK
jgi:hypothetical protein